MHDTIVIYYSGEFGSILSDVYVHQVLNIQPGQFQLVLEQKHPEPRYVGRSDQPDSFDHNCAGIFLPQRSIGFQVDGKFVTDQLLSVRWTRF